MVAAGSKLKIPIDRQRIADFCRRHHIQKLALFGSVLRDDFRGDSDVDVLYIFDPDHVPGWDFHDIEQELAGIFGRRVDMVSEKYLSRWIRDKVMGSAEVLYEQR